LGFAELTPLFWSISFNHSKLLVRARHASPELPGGRSATDAIGSPG
jgi:hypothetical protein